MGDVTVREARLLKKELEENITNFVRVECDDFTTKTGMPVKSVVLATGVTPHLELATVTLDFKI